MFFETVIIVKTFSAVMCQNSFRLCTRTPLTRFGKSNTIQAQSEFLAVQPTPSDIACGTVQYEW